MFVTITGVPKMSSKGYPGIAVGRSTFVQTFWTREMFLVGCSVASLLSTCGRPLEKNTISFHIPFCSKPCFDSIRPEQMAIKSLFPGYTWAPWTFSSLTLSLLKNIGKQAGVTEEPPVLCERVAVVTFKGWCTPEIGQPWWSVHLWSRCECPRPNYRLALTLTSYLMCLIIPAS